MGLKVNNDMGVAKASIVKEVLREQRVMYRLMNGEDVGDEEKAFMRGMGANEFMEETLGVRGDHKEYVLCWKGI